MCSARAWVSWGPTNWSFSGVPMSVTRQQSAAKPVVMMVFGGPHGDVGPSQEEDYTYRRASGWAFLDPRQGRTAYSAIHKKESVVPKQGESRLFGTKQASKGNINRHRKVRAASEEGDRGHITERKGCYPRHILRALSGILLWGYTGFLLPPNRREKDTEIRADSRA